MSIKERSTVVLGVTGGIACGKSEAGRFLGEMGFNVCDADHVAHRLMKVGSPVYDRVVERFGSGILAEAGRISRPKLAQLVFDDEALLRQLNQLVHPAVRNELERWIAARRNADERGAVLLPLLFESGMQNLGWDAVLCISSRTENIIKRLQARGLSCADAERRISSQMTLAEKERLADYVVANNGNPEELKTALRSVVAAIEGEREV